MNAEQAGWHNGLEPDSTGPVLVTGANGFVGRTLCNTLRAAGCEVRKVGRRLELTNNAGPADGVTVGDVGPETDWTKALKGIDAVVHLAARVHVMQDTAANPLAEFRKVNVAGTERLARQAAAAGVRRLVFVSSIKVNGEATGERAFSEEDPSAPQDPYGVSKWEAEQALQRIAAETGLEVVIVRPPLVYGPGVKGNFVRLLKLIDRGIPLPLASVANRRSLISLWNLCDLLERCITHPHAAGETFLAADGEDLSTPELMRHLARGLNRPARLFPFPPGLLYSGARLLGREAMIDRLCGSLQVDIGKARQVLGWMPPVSVEEGLERTAQWYRFEQVRD